jgi:hypothetical protein
VSVRARAAAVVAGGAILAALLPAVAVRFAPRALREVGPNDAGYVEGFRDWERDVRTRFRWTGLRSAVVLPVRMHGAGHVLRARLRRHFVEPATLALRLDGRLVTTLEVSADTRTPYRTVEVPLPPQDGRPFRLEIEARTAHPAPLGVAVDWVEIVARDGARLALPADTHLRLALVAAAVALLVLAVGGGARPALAFPLLIAAAAAFGAYADPIALERIVRLGTAPLLATAGVAFLACRWPPARRALLLDTAWAPAVVLVLVAGGCAARLALLLHPQFFYPDVRVHGLVAWELARRGLGTFLEEYQASQFRYSLGLQEVGGHWYAFPYPPGFYILCWPLIRLGGLRPEVAVAIVGACANALSAALTWGIARRLALGPAAAALATAAHATLPFFAARLALAYFPTLAGQLLDAVVLLFVLANLERLAEPRRVALLAGLMTAAFLTYTQSLLNFAVIFGLFAALHLARRDARPRAERVRLVAALAIAGLVATAAATLLFYRQYAPAMAALRAGAAVPEERILLEKMARAPVDPNAVPEEPDPFAGPGLDPWRGVRKAAWRLYVFYGLFAPLVVLGVILALRPIEPPWKALAVAWALTYVVLNLASGGLPSPNLVRHNKDLEVVAPVMCVGLAALIGMAWRRSRPIAVLLVLGWLAFSAVRYVRYLTETFVLER